MTSLVWPFAASSSFVDMIDIVGSSSTLGNGRFAARNFSLEWGAPDRRIASYFKDAGRFDDSADATRSLQALNSHHNGYLDRHVRAGVRTDKFDPSVPTCPDTFLDDAALVECGGTKDGAFLLRLEDLRVIAREVDIISPREFREFKAILERVADGRRSGKMDAVLTKELGHLLAQWQCRMDNRPIFTCFWGAAESIMADPRPGWAEELRDRLGLFQYDPDGRDPGSGIDVVAFKYPVELVPKRHPAGPRFLVRPTVLDTRVSEAFCTAEEVKAASGYCVDLAARGEAAWQEVLHPAIELRADHVWTVDVIHSRPPVKLDEARGLHLLGIFDSCGADFRARCERVEADIL